MTLLITVATPEYSLSVSDQRITAVVAGKTRIVDEAFNKHIYFATSQFLADISYTGVAQWTHQGKRVNLYILIADAVAEVVPSNPSISELSLHVYERLKRALQIPAFARQPAAFELHINCRFRELPVCGLIVISTFRKTPPWSQAGEFDYEWHFGDFYIFLKALVEASEVIFGGADAYVSTIARDRIQRAVVAGADAFNCARLASKIVRDAARKTDVIGSTMVAIVIPRDGMVDTNLWEKGEQGLIGYLPQMVFPNGTQWAATQFPVDIHLLSDGQLPKQSLFFKSLASSLLKRRDFRRLLRRRSGPYVPGLMGLISIGLFGAVPDGFDDFGFGG